VLPFLRQGDEPALMRGSHTPGDLFHPAEAQGPVETVLLDITLPDAARGNAGSELLQVWVLTTRPDADVVRQFLEAGGTGRLVKLAATDRLIQAIRSMAAEGSDLEPEPACALVATLASPAGPSPNADGVLSEQERRVLRRVAQGYSNKEIAAQLAVSTKTVETYKTRATDKLGLYSRVDLIRFALAHDWLRED
jgi:DNA-binding NarL/FixJ family response regulator